MRTKHKCCNSTMRSLPLIYVCMQSLQRLQDPQTNFYLDQDIAVNNNKLANSNVSHFIKMKLVFCHLPNRMQDFGKIPLLYANCTSQQVFHNNVFFSVPVVTIQQKSEHKGSFILQTQFVLESNSDPNQSFYNHVKIDVLH